jgi:hypothetical protein
MARMARRAAVGAVAALVVLTMAAPAQAKRLVRYEVNGGFADIHHEIVVDTDGTAEAAGKRFTVKKWRMRALRRSLREAEFSTLKRRYMPKYPVSDGTVSTIHYGGYSVAIYSGAELPRRLERVLTHLNRVNQ